MNTAELLAGLAGGVGLFLLGIGLMTDGLKLAAGPALERVLAHSTKTRLRGLASGVLITALVQSSSAVTVAAIGFVSAGLLNLSQALWVLFGANVGATMNGWLVVLVALQFKIEALALPLIGIGMFLRLSGNNNRRSALGLALAGFGLLFVGVDLLSDTFSSVSATFRLPTGTGVGAVLSQMLIGSVLTVLMQSSSASLAIALTAAKGGLLTPYGAAAVVIGANIGTTVTAVIAAIGAVPNARRAAAAHVLFNLLTGTVALLLLPWLVDALAVASDWFGLKDEPAAQLAMFHTVFNLLGIVLIWPIAARMTAFLQTCFRAAEEDEARPRFIDNTVLGVPALVLNALEQEVRNLGGIALRTVYGVLGPSPAVDGNQRIVALLSRAIAEFIIRLNRSGMSEVSAKRLPQLLRIARYYEAVAELAKEAVQAAHEGAARQSPDAPVAEYDAAFRRRADVLLALIHPDSSPDDTGAIDNAVHELEVDYQRLKAELLEAGARGELAVSAMDARLRAASALHRALDQAVKAIRLLSCDIPAR